MKIRTTHFRQQDIRRNERKWKKVPKKLGEMFAYGGGVGWGGMVWEAKKCREKGSIQCQGI